MDIIIRCGFGMIFAFSFLVCFWGGGWGGVGGFDLGRG